MNSTQTTERSTYALHTPERHPLESLKQYRERQRQSKGHAAIVTAKGSDEGVKSRAKFRNDMRKNGSMGRRIRAYVALMAAWAAKRVTKSTLRDKHGAITLIGVPIDLIGIKPSTREFEVAGGIDHGEQYHTVRRIWLGGISARRGY